jgi:hypothetical protein
MVGYMMESKQYDDQFFMEMEAGSLASAKGILPLVNQVIHPRSIIDVGCGTGVWLSVWDRELGISDYLGVEGPYVQKEMVKIPSGKLLLKDLKEPLGLSRKFDLAMSLEVAEHLPESCARQFVRELTVLSDVILFSAAIPGQGGTYHINEQYPEYWASLFKESGYIVIDAIRPQIWNDASVEFWYRQNILLFVKENVLSAYPQLGPYAAATKPDYLARVHPVFFDRINEHMRRTKSLAGFMNWKWYVFKTKFLKKK